MRKIAKTLLLTGMLSMSLGLAACGSDSGSNGQSGSDPVVTFRLNYKKTAAEDVFKEVTVKKGECVEEPEEEPVREDFIFDGWHDDQDKDSEFDFEEPITKNTKIFAHWLERLTCTFDLNYAGAPEATKVEVIQKQAATRPADPTRAGYAFIGWVVDKDTQQEYFDFTRPFSEDLTLCAKWGAEGSP